MEATRRRIAGATFDLHATVGPARTTIAAVADRAGVQRATVYRHFPDEVSLFRACVAHGYREHPPPDVEGWTAIADPEERLRTGLGELYAYFAANETLWANVTRDMPGMPALLRANSELGTFDLWARMRDILTGGWAARGQRRRLLRSAIGHALEFGTWRSLVRTEKLDDRGAVELLVRTVRCLTA